jgi:uncharacterized protein
MNHAPLPESIDAILARCRTIAVVGLSPQADRPSHQVARYLQDRGYRIVPIHPGAAQSGAKILGEPCYASVQAAAQALAAQGQSIDMVDCFRRSEEIPPLAQAAIDIGATCLWLQLGVTHPEAEAHARAAGLQVVRDRCPKIELARIADERARAACDNGDL